MNRLLVSGIACLLGLWLIGCKKEVKSTDVVNRTIEDTRTIKQEQQDTVEKENRIDIKQQIDSVSSSVEKDQQDVFAWNNLYEGEGDILNQAVRLLKVNKSKAIALMDESNQLKVKNNSLYKVFDGLKSTELKDLLGEELRQSVIANGGLGVNIRVSVSPNPAEDGASERGNFYSFAIYENYETHMATLAHVIFDVRTLSYYKLDAEGSYVMLPCPDSVKKTLANIVQN
ncbi:MAG: hypothetical protein LBE34_16035 [Flavobacteriaceae bacterium]|nr:hypothetical protein [Flavobacteriaceae bacterium]